ncbi:hypothetical protein DC31_06385 [Microbacterium sp. CH12i]|uniref:hypothetical protein n=1 Tax=Microbacterium sp. CH12i TaxID=1479651 RepID=UPI000462055F|nr:hypothetical protein [Microbacterium sp. CH12i]KDA04573.1 hypothetical protein DC31_06385 [Microbacterium sp. CH12i]
MSDPAEPQVREQKPRRKMGALVDPVLVNWRIERTSRAFFNEVAARSRMSVSEFVDSMATNMELTDQGIPPWVPELDRDGELPIDTA